MNIVWNLAGYLSVGLGLIGIVVPGMPTTVFFIIALGCFTKSENSRLRRWLLNHKQFGPILRDWEETQSIPLKIKWISCSCIVVFSTFSLFVIPPVWVKGVVVAIAVAGVGYICSRPTKPVPPSIEAEEAPTLDLAS